jgi:hypothetical protein
LIILSISFSASCTHAVPPETPPLPRFKSVAILSKGPAEELKARFGSVNEASKAGRGGEADGGALYPIIYGPEALAGFLIMIPIAALVSAVSHGIEDSAADSLTEPEREQLVVLEKLFGDVVEQRTLDVEIRDALVPRIPPDRLVDTASAEALLQLSLFDVQFTQTSSGKYTLTLKALLIAQWLQRTQHLDHGRRLYRHTTPALSLKDWVKDDGQILNQAFDDCVASLGDQIAADIQFREP